MAAGKKKGIGEAISSAINIKAVWKNIKWERGNGMEILGRKSRFLKMGARKIIKLRALYKSLPGCLRPSRP